MPMGEAYTNGLVNKAEKKMYTFLILKIQKSYADIHLQKYVKDLPSYASEYK